MPVEILKKKNKVLDCSIIIINYRIIVIINAYFIYIVLIVKIVDKFRRIFLRARGNFEEKNKVLDCSIIIINYCIIVIINAYLIYIVLIVKIVDKFRRIFLRARGNLKKKQGLGLFHNYY